jgi:hypothetical protein
MIEFIANFISELQVLIVLSLSRIVIIVLTYHRYKPIDGNNLLVSYQRYNVFPVRYGQTYRVELRTMDNVQNCNSYVKIPSLQICRCYFYNETSLAI